MSPTDELTQRSFNALRTLLAFFTDYIQIPHSELKQLISRAREQDDILAQFDPSFLKDYKPGANDFEVYEYRKQLDRYRAQQFPRRDLLVALDELAPHALAVAARHSANVELGNLRKYEAHTNTRMLTSDGRMISHGLLPDDTYHIAHLSDLHFPGRPRTRANHLILSSYGAEKFQQDTLDALTRDIVQLRPNHIVITGDITNTAHPCEFDAARRWLLSLQGRLRQVEGAGRLDPELFTIIPGNHDVSTSYGGSGLGRFLDAFGETLPDLPAHGGARSGGLVTCKSLGGCVDLFTVNSCRDISVFVPGLNSVGRVGRQQLATLVETINRKRSPARYRIVACHHHPLIVPSDRDDFDRFLMMKDARAVVDALFRCEVDLILHGHKHIPFIWESRLQQGQRHKMTVISAGSPTVERGGSGYVYNRVVALRTNRDGVTVADRVASQFRKYCGTNGAFENDGQMNLIFAWDRNRHQAANESNGRNDRG